MRVIALLCVFGAVACAQEANSGFELRTTVSAVTAESQELSDAPRDGSR